MTEPATTYAQASLKAHPLCLEIVQFLIDHENAMDTVKGIADCWVRNDLAAVQTALDLLITSGLVTMYTLSSGPLYGLTRSASMREWLRTSYTSD
jgi:hypothetical protein